MRSTIWVVAITGLVTALGACSGKDHAGSIGAIGTGDDGGTRSVTPKGGSQSTTEAGDNAGGAGGNATENGPLVKVTFPAASASPDDDAIVDDVIKATCTVTDNGPAVDPTSVHLLLKDSMGMVLADQKASPTEHANEYATDLIVATVPAGAIQVECTATDKSQQRGDDSIATFLDHGPTITVISPTPSSAHAVKGGLNIAFNVEPTLLAKEDSGASVDTVSFMFDGKPFDVQETSPGKFETDLPLDDVNIFPVTPTGAISITATNKRKPKAATAANSYSVLIDGDGPLITIEQPTPQSVRGGTVTLLFSVTDSGSGVDPKSVYATLYPGDTPRLFDTMKGWSLINGKYAFAFDTKLIEPYQKVQTTINVRATDQVGNPSATGQSVQIYLDNAPPQVDLDPQNIRTMENGTCSGSFDPVGSAALNDLDGSQGQPAVYRFGWFRTFVMERTNSEEGQDLHYFAGTDTTKTRLYIQTDPENAPVKLLVNKNPGTDDTCDDIGNVDATVGAPDFTAMTALAAASGIYHADDPGQIPLIDPDPMKAVCKLSGGGTTPNLCPGNTSDLWTVPYNHPINEPVLYAVGTPNPSNDSCTGVDLSFFSKNQPEGWICLAARAVDKAGNVGISPPLRICADNPDTAEQPACAISSTVPPSCTDGCTPPARGGNLILR